MLRIVVATVWLAAAAWSAPDPTVEAFCTGDEKARGIARRQLLRRGTPALKSLRARMKHTKEKARRTRIEKLVREIEAREPHGISMRIGIPKLRFTVAHAHSEQPGLLLTLHNKSMQGYVLWPYVSLRILDAAGQEVNPARRGRWGRRKRAYLLDVSFLDLPAGGRQSLRFSLRRYRLDPLAILSWKGLTAGRYTLEMTYHYNRAAAKTRVRMALPGINDPAQPWNRAPEFSHVVTAGLNVVP